MIYQEVLDRCPHIDVRNLSRDEWLEKRRSFIGGSDVGYIMELSDYGSAYTLFMEKKGKVHTEENEAMLRGSIMEPYIRQITKREFPFMEIEEAAYIFQNKEKPYMGANVDGFIYIVPGTGWKGYVGSSADWEKCVGLGIHEIKTSQSGYGFSENEVPDTYYAQVQHYMSVLDLPWAVITVFILDKNKIRHYPILRDDTFINNMMIPQEKTFWEDYYLKDIVPAPIGLKAEEEMITGEFSGSEPLELEGELRDLCGVYATKKQQVKALEEEIQAVKLKLMDGIARQAKGKPEERKVSAEAGAYKVSWITVERKDVDRDALKKAGLYDKYLKLSSYDRFTVTEKKGA
jgi:putative phage-type endonuclease